MGIASMLPLRALLLAAATICASGFAPYAGPDLESFDFDYQGLRIAAPLLGAGQLGPYDPVDPFVREPFPPALSRPPTCPLRNSSDEDCSTFRGDSN